MSKFVIFINHIKSYIIRKLE
ncbi:Interleukin-10 domain protein [Bovine gammaherpesvirus 6]|uniref:Interleukin-10 domain protein n=1 Tax=Bovine gammaherpesvirus 6 TaxID=1504288 RepID=A0A060CTX9_9GAMA|nr:Interleukin-10 domain protein [Bovine gammaherpesvirus 6]AIB03157.1 Interleukin-10 domain protein [Bovine gammaherpesvirus 6]